MFFLYVGTVLVGLPAILLFPTFLPHVLTFVINRRRIKGRIGAASFKFQWPGFVTLEVNDVKLTNPHGFEHEIMAELKMARGTVNVWSLFTKSIKVGAIVLQDVDVNVERQKGKGVNVLAYLREVRGEAAPEMEMKQGDEEGLDSESDSNLVLSLVGMVQEKSDRVVDNLAAAVEKDGGLGNFAKNTTANVLTGVFDKVANVVGLTGDVLKSKAKSLDEDVKKSGGIDKFVVNTTQNVATAVTDKAKEGLNSVKDNGLTGAASFAASNVSEAVGTVASRADNALLQEALHRKVIHICVYTHTNTHTHNHTHTLSHTHTQIITHTHKHTHTHTHSHTLTHIVYIYIY
jgi:hypothetical protein